MSSFWRFWANFDLAPAWFQDTTADIALRIGQISYVVNTDLQDHVEQYRGELAQNKVILVAHSQGNFYANDAYAVVFNGNNGGTPLETNSLGIVSVATFASSVADDGPHTTLFGDWAVDLYITSIIALNLPLPFPLFPNTPGIGHDFETAYLDGAASGQKILKDIVDVILGLEAPISLPGPQPGPNVGDIVRIPMLSGGLSGISVEAGGATALVTEGGELSRLNLTTSEVTSIAVVAPTLASPVLTPDGMHAIVITSPGAGGLGSGLARVNLVTGQVETIVLNGIDRAAAMAMEAGGTSVLVTGSEGGLSRVDLATGVITPISGTGGGGIAIEPGGATVIIATGIFGIGPFSCDLVRVDLNTGVTTFIARISCTDRPTAVAIEPGGASALVTTTRQSATGASRIFRVDLNTGAVTFLTNCPSCNNTRITLEPSGTSALFVGNVGGSLFRLDLFTLSQSLIVHSDSPRGMVLAPGGDAVFTVSNAPGFLSGQLSRVDLGNGRVERIIGFSQPTGGIDLTSDGGTVFITAFGFQQIFIQKVDLVNLTVSNVVATSFSEFGGFQDLSLENAETTALITAGDGKSLLRVDLVTGAIGVVSDQLVSPLSVEVEQDGVSALVVQGGNGGSLVRVDLLTGAVIPITTNLGSIRPGITLEPSLESVLINTAIDLLRVDLATGNASTVLTPICTSPAGPIGGVSGVSVEQGGQTALISHEACGILRARIN